MALTCSYDQDLKCHHRRASCSLRVLAIDMQYITGMHMQHAIDHEFSCRLKFY